LDALTVLFVFLLAFLAIRLAAMIVYDRWSRLKGKRGKK